MKNTVTQKLTSNIENIMEVNFGTDLATGTKKQVYEAIMLATNSILKEKRSAFSRKVKDTEAKQVYCQIFFYEGANYVRSIGKKDIFLKRKGKKVMVNDLGIKLLSKDSFTVDKTTFQIEFL